MNYTIKKVTRFQTSNGKDFNTEEDAQGHLILLQKIDKIVKLLGGTNNEIDHSCDFANGGGYYTIPENDYEVAKMLSYDLLKELGMPNIDICSRQAYEHEDFYIISNIFMAIGDNYKRYGQPYYKRNADNCTDFEYNPIYRK